MLSRLYTKSFQERKTSIDVIKSKYPDRYPVYVGLGENANKKGLVLSNHKYLVPPGISMGQFYINVRKKINISEAEGLFFYIVSPHDTIHIPTSSNIVSYLHDKYVHNDGYMYVLVDVESVFGHP